MKLIPKEGPTWFWNDLMDRFAVHRLSAPLIAFITLCTTDRWSLESPSTDSTLRTSATIPCWPFRSSVRRSLRCVSALLNRTLCCLLTLRACHRSRRLVKKSVRDWHVGTRALLTHRSLASARSTVMGTAPTSDAAPGEDGTPATPVRVRQGLIVPAHGKKVWPVMIMAPVSRHTLTLLADDAYT